MPSFRQAVALTVLLGALCACSTEPPPEQRVALIDVTPKTARLLVVGDSAAFSVSITTAAGTDGAGIPVSWSSKDQSLVVISPTGVARALKKGGSTYIFASAGGKTDSALVEIPLTPCGSTQSPTLQPGDVSGDIGEEGFCAPAIPKSEYAVIAYYSSLTSSASTTIEVIGQGLATIAPSPSLGSAFNRAVPVRLRRPRRRDVRSEVSFREAEKRALSPLLADAQQWYRVERNGAVRATAVPAVGDLRTVNVSMGTGCSTASRVDHVTRVAAVSDHAIILHDQTNPAGGFTDDEYAHFATLFDTLINPLDTATFGNPTDLDKNGRVIILFTRAVNELTPKGSDTYTSGRTMSRDLFPTTSDGVHAGCDASNVGEIFYMLAPDPNNQVNGDSVFHKDFVAEQTPATIAHEFQHMINISRRMYLLPNQTTATWIDEVWLHEGLSHMAEELLFHKMTGLPTRSNIGLPDIINSPPTLDAFNDVMLGDFFNYDAFANSSTQSSPFQQNDDVTTRGGTWAFLRYVVDQLGSSDGDLFYRLVNTNLTGLTNLTTQLGFTSVDLQTWLRRFAVSVYADDFLRVPARYTQPSWNMRSMYGGFDNPAFTFPLTARPLADNSAIVTALAAGAFSVYEFAPAAGSSGFVHATGPSGTPMPPGVRLTVVRVK